MDGPGGEDAVVIGRGFWLGFRLGCGRMWVVRVRGELLGREVCDAPGVAWREDRW